MNPPQEVTIPLILEVFGEVRERDVETYNPDKLVHYLISNPDGKKNIHNSFKGKRYLTKFYDELEKRFAVCFAPSDPEKIQREKDFFQKISYLQSNPLSSQKSLKKRIKNSFSPLPYIVIGFLGAFVSLVAYLLFPYFGIITALLSLFVLAWMARINLLQSIHNRKLKEIINANKAVERNAEIAPLPQHPSH